jgi:hypothetical protein
VNNLVRLGLIAVLASCGTPAKSEARLGAGTGATPGGCPFATDNGCAAANHNGSFQNPSLLTSAQQSGQTSLLPKHPMTFNIPAVDYPIGPDKTLTPKDPRTIKYDGTCAYIGTGANAPPNDFVGCYGAGVKHEVLDNYDFSGAKIGKPPLGLYMNGDASAGSTMTITNSYFYIPSINSKAIGYTGNWSIIFKNNQCDGSKATLASQFCFGDDGSAAGTTLDAEYNAFTNQKVARVLGGGRNMARTYKYNFIQGLNDQLSANHGEVELGTCGGRACTSVISVSHQEGNFIIWNANSPDGSNNNATFFPSTGDSDGLKFAATKIINNVVVTNTSGARPSPSSPHQIGQVLFGMRAASLGDVTITGNWMDATGATGCGVNGVTSGGDSVTASTSGNTLIITGTSSSFNNNPIEPGWKIFHSGFATATITAFGTGRGHLGTYTFDGAPQTLGPDSAWTVVPGFTNATLTGNYNLADPSRTGTPTPVGFRGPTMREATCLGAHN